MALIYQSREEILEYDENYTFTYVYTEEGSQYDETECFVELLSAKYKGIECLNRLPLRHLECVKEYIIGIEYEKGAYRQEQFEIDERESDRDLF